MLRLKKLKWGVLFSLLNDFKQHTECTEFYYRNAEVS